LCFVFFFAVFAIVFHTEYVSAIAKKDSRQQFSDFVEKYSKDYHPVDLQNKFQTFQQNLKRVDELNQKYEDIGKVGPYGVTKFFDLTPAEFKKFYLGKITRPTVTSQPKIATSPTDIPTAFDWSSKGAVTPVYNQGECGSCWAFSATEAIESQWFLAGNTLISLAAQQIVDCDKVDLGCEGGDTPTAYQYVINATGMETTSDYPYTAEDQTCSFQVSKVKASIKSWGYITQNKNETEMLYGLYAKGPLSICVEADTWQYYVGGVISSDCGVALDHCVMITGYQTMRGWDFIDYDVWNIRNSWGEDWGVDGYLYVERGSNLCGVAEEVTLPIV